jgi:hypothetical protein
MQGKEELNRNDAAGALLLAGYSAAEAKHLAECFASPVGGSDIQVLLAHSHTVRASSMAIRAALAMNQAWLAALEGR